MSVVSARVVAIRPEPDLERALQTPTREAVQREADRATYARRAGAVEQERAIAENELQNKIELARREQQLVEQHGANARRKAELDASAALVAVVLTSVGRLLVAGKRPDQSVPPIASLSGD